MWLVIGSRKAREKGMGKSLQLAQYKGRVVSWQDATVQSCSGDSDLRVAGISLRMACS